jgi:hypothetical protein
MERPLEKRGRYEAIKKETLSTKNYTNNFHK